MNMINSLKKKLPDVVYNFHISKCTLLMSCAISWIYKDNSILLPTVKGPSYLLQYLHADFVLHLHLRTQHK